MDEPRQELRRALEAQLKNKAEIKELIETLADQVAVAVAKSISSSGLMDRLEDLARITPDRIDPVCEEDTGQDPTPEQPGETPSKRLCSEADCDKPARARGLCSKHYQRLRYAEKRAAEDGEPIPTSLQEAATAQSRKPARKTARRGGGSCSVESCDQPNYAKEMCGKHFMEWVRAKKNA